MRICAVLAAGMSLREVRAMQLERAQKIASEVVERLRPCCTRIEIAGSIRRRKPVVNDIDIVLIAKDRPCIDAILMQLGSVRMSGKKIARVQMEDISVDLYFATPETWAALLLIRTGSKENNIRLCTLARKRGWHLAASGDGLFDENGRRIAGDSEQSIYRALDLPWQSPEERG